MDRRHFVKLSAISLASLWACEPNVKSWESIPYDIDIQSDMKVGHQLFDAVPKNPMSNQRTETLIIGGGIAGLSAAYHLKNKDFLLCELSSSLGGSSSKGQYKNISFGQGAHYDLSYPNYFGKKTLHFLEEINIVNFNKNNSIWEFNDKQHLINYDYEIQCLENNTFRDDVLIRGESFEYFQELVSPFLGKLTLPTRLITSEFRHLDQLTFFDFLSKHEEISADLLKGIDYQMIDDFSGTSKQVSALAGLYYYASRPYLSTEYETFSPPEGNFYFIKKISERLPKEALLSNHLVYKIEKKKNKFEALVLDIKSNETKKITCNKVIYAGQKHGLKYISKKDYNLFSDNETAPWLVINFVFKDLDLGKGFWQNEIFNTQKSAMGFVDSNSQNLNEEYRVLTSYYCFPSSERKRLLTIDTWADKLANQTLENIAFYFGKKPSFFRKKLQKTFIKVMGHAMTIPKPNFLFKDKNDFRPDKNFVYAGVDNSRLPLLFEALDSGIVAAKLLL